jgi:Zn-dependent peptidase ImmA (M78 family)/transcriptional regulator with XRE-family HTH domain
VTDAVRLGQAIRARRKALGVTQEQLAAALGFNAAQTVSDIERGERSVKAWELVKIADALSTTVEDLLELRRTSDDVHVLWRRGSTAASSELEGKFLDRSRRYALLERWNALPPAPQLPQLELDPDRDSFRDAAKLARTVGKALDLGSRPAAALAAVLVEVFRVKIFFEHLGEDESAASAKGDFGYAILMNANQAPWRRNYNLAHEVFHLVTWDATVGALNPAAGAPFWLDRIERLANAFASHLLLPADEVEARFDIRFSNGELRYGDLVEMAREFDVSTEALVWRLRLMNKLSQEQAEQILEDPEFRREDRRSMPGSWDRPPRGPLPDRYWRLALNAYRRGEVTLARLANLLETSVSQAGELVDGWEDGREAAAAPA